MGEWQRYFDANALVREASKLPVVDLDGMKQMFGEMGAESPGAHVFDFVAATIGPKILSKTEGEPPSAGSLVRIGGTRRDYLFTPKDVQYMAEVGRVMQHRGESIHRVGGDIALQIRHASIGRVPMLGIARNVWELDRDRMTLSGSQAMLSRKIAGALIAGTLDPLGEQPRQLCALGVPKGRMDDFGRAWRERLYDLFGDGQRSFSDMPVHWQRTHGVKLTRVLTKHGIQVRSGSRSPLQWLAADLVRQGIEVVRVQPYPGRPTVRYTLLSLEEVGRLEAWIGQQPPEKIAELKSKAKGRFPLSNMMEIAREHLTHGGRTLLPDQFSLTPMHVARLVSEHLGRRVSAKHVESVMGSLGIDATIEAGSVPDFVRTALPVGDFVRVVEEMTGL